MDKPTYYEEFETVHRIYTRSGPIPASRGGMAETRPMGDYVIHIHRSQCEEVVDGPPPQEWAAGTTSK